MRALFCIAAGFVLSVNGANAIPTGTTYRAVMVNTNDGRLVNSDTNFAAANGIATTGQVGDVVGSLADHAAATNPHAITPGMIGAVGTDGVSSMNGHLIMNFYKGVITGTNSLILPLSANADAEYSQGGGHIALLSKSLGGAVQMVAYDPTGAVRRIEFYVGSNMNVTAATIEIDGFHGNGSGITGLTAEQCGSMASSNFPATTAYQVTWETDTNTIVVTDAGGTNAPSNPQSWGVLQNAYLATNTNGWYLYGTEYRDPGSFGYYTMTSGVPGNWVGSGDPATGTVSVVYAQHLVTNAITWPGIVTNIVGVSTQIQYYSTIGNLTNVIRLP